MECVVFIGLQGSGKSSFYKDRFFDSHTRVSLDLLKSRHRERKMLEVCLSTDQRFVVDNTNPKRTDRLNYISLAKARRFKIIGYYFQSKVEDCRRRNADRPEGRRVPDVAILSTAKSLQIPGVDEGFDELFHVQIRDSQFIVEEWRDEV